MRWSLLVVLAAGCGSVEPIGPPESSGDSWTAGATDAGTATHATGTDSDTQERTDSSVTTSGADDASTSGGTNGAASSSSTGARADASDTGDCVAGELGCACLPMTGCAEGLTCASDICIPDLPCAPDRAGQETCQCSEGGGCDAGLVCASMLCVDPDG